MSALQLSVGETSEHATNTKSIVGEEEGQTSRRKRAASRHKVDDFMHARRSTFGCCVVLCRIGGGIRMIEREREREDKHGNNRISNH